MLVARLAADGVDLCGIVCGWTDIAGRPAAVVAAETAPMNGAIPCYPTHMDGLLYGALAAIWVRTFALEATLRQVWKVLPFTLGVLALGDCFRWDRLFTSVTDGGARFSSTCSYVYGDSVVLHSNRGPS